MSSLIEFARGFFATTIAFNGNSLSVTWGSFILAFVLPVLALFVIIRLLVFFIRRLLAKSQMKEETRARVMRWFRIVYRIIFVLVVALLTADLLGDQIMESLQSIVGFLREPFFTSGNTSISVVTLLMLVPIFYVATWAGNSTRRVLEQGVLDKLSIDPSRKFSIVSLSRYGVMIIVVVIGLSVVGINLSSLAVIFGVLGLGIGFGLQGVVANLFAGLMIILSRPIKEGDRVEIAGLEGDVKQIRVLYSVVNTLTDETLIIPNREIVENIVHNQSYDHPSIILFTNVQVSYRSDLDKVKAVLTRVGEESPFLFAGRQPRVLFRSFDNSGITVTLAVPIRSARERHVATSEIMLDIWRAFRATGIEIPFPQMDLYVKQLPPEGGSGGSI